MIDEDDLIAFEVDDRCQSALHMIGPKPGS